MEDDEFGRYILTKDEYSDFMTYKINKKESLIKYAYMQGKLIKDLLLYLFFFSIGILVGILFSLLR